MADKNSKVKENIAGPYYVDNQCIACDACIVEASDFFKMNEEDGLAFVFKQPSSEEDIEKCENAFKACPVEAIGKDGD